MVRTLLGGVLGGVALYLVGFLFWGTPLSGLAFNSLDEAPSAAAQLALAQTLGPTGTGAYIIPSADTAAGSVLYGKGPVAMVHFNMSGFPVVDSGALGAGFVLAVITGLLIAFALGSIASRVTDFTSRARIALAIALIGTLYAELGQPIFNHFGWAYWIYLWLSDFIGLSVAGLLIAKWFLPKTPAAS